MCPYFLKYRHKPLSKTKKQSIVQRLFDLPIVNIS